MRQVRRRSVPSWRVPDARALQPGWIVAALLLLAVLLLEVWQQSAVASLSLRLGHATDQLKRAGNERDWMRAQLERNTTRAEVASLATSAGVRPAESAQVVWLPSDYLEEDGAGPGQDGSPALLAAAGHALQSLVPEAKARSRHVN